MLPVKDTASNGQIRGIAGYFSTVSVFSMTSNLRGLSVKTGTILVHLPDSQLALSLSAFMQLANLLNLTIRAYARSASHETIKNTPTKSKSRRGSSTSRLLIDKMLAERDSGRKMAASTVKRLTPSASWMFKRSL